mmetsp:Transcript_20627/g.58693  ORF Transcript_20627/g.58693 Transcript_20627/m.58693 type:complete len:204 (-) Transcript_20627:29-640(-)
MRSSCRRLGEAVGGGMTEASSSSWGLWCWLARRESTSPSAFVPAGPYTSMACRATVGDCDCDEVDCCSCCCSCSWSICCKYCGGTASTPPSSVHLISHCCRSRFRRFTSSSRCLSADNSARNLVLYALCRLCFCRGRSYEYPFHSTSTACCGCCWYCAGGRSSTRNGTVSASSFLLLALCFRRSNMVMACLYVCVYVFGYVID